MHVSFGYFKSKSTCCGLIIKIGSLINKIKYKIN